VRAERLLRRSYPGAIWGTPGCFRHELRLARQELHRGKGTQVTAGLAIGFVVGALVAIVVASLSRAVRAGKDETEHAVALGRARAEAEQLKAELEAERRVAAERQIAWDEARSALKGEFATLSAAALRQSNEQFLQLANGRLELAQQSAKSDLDQRTKSIEQLLDPLREQLGRYEEGLHRLESERQRAYAGLVQQVKQLGDSHDRLQLETRNLVTALRAPATRGRWGELQLRRVMEMAGMLEHCDFDEQVTSHSESGRLRPDVVVRLSGGRNVVVDAKVPLQAFLEAMEAADEGTRKTGLIGHARQLRSHVDSLSKKAYWQQFDVTPEFVIAFIPGDPLLAAALEHDPSLLDHAVEHRVILATPTSLIALLRTIAFGWQQESLAENALEVQKAGRELYKRLSTFGEHLAKAGRGLGGAVDAYNKAVGSLERNVLPQARRLSDLGVGVSDQPVPEPEPIDAMPRLLQAPELVAGDQEPVGEGADDTEAEPEGPVRMLPFAGIETISSRRHG
jgi:DNA recombination protein RmuC